MADPIAFFILRVTAEDGPSGVEGVLASFFSRALVMGVLAFLPRLSSFGDCGPEPSSSASFSCLIAGVPGGVFLLPRGVPGLSLTCSLGLGLDSTCCI